MIVLAPYSTQIGQSPYSGEKPDIMMGVREEEFLSPTYTQMELGEGIGNSDVDVPKSNTAKVQTLIFEWYMEQPKIHVFKRNWTIGSK